MFEKIREVIVAELGVEADEVTLEASIIDDLGADSLDVVELIMALEDEFDIKVEDDQAQNMRTVQDILKYIEGLK
ncbi:MAG: acyl carrier protein [Candidatus Izemoplasmataceae bacterium]|jgi:acyl carrier protein|uniref:acyl carrier protein n=1 Tax=Liberiplasma polymorphum TaxID=3374570 RepID=UPI00377554A4